MYSNVKSESINFYTKIKSWSHIFPSIFNSSHLNLQYNIDFNSSNYFQVISFHPIVAMQHDDEIAICQEFGNGLTSLDVARLRLDATPMFEHRSFISRTSATLCIYEAREDGYV